MVCICKQSCCRNNPSITGNNEHKLYPVSKKCSHLLLNLASIFGYNVADVTVRSRYSEISLRLNQELFACKRRVKILHKLF